MIQSFGLACLQAAVLSSLVANILGHCFALFRLGCNPFRKLSTTSGRGGDMCDLIIRCGVVLFATAIVGWSFIDVTEKSSGTNAPAASQSALPSGRSFARPAWHAGATAAAGPSAL